MVTLLRMQTLHQVPTIKMKCTIPLEMCHEYSLRAYRAMITSSLTCHNTRPDAHFSRSMRNCFANAIIDNTSPLDSDCCVGETGPRRQNLRTGSACKTDTCLDTTSVGDRTQYTTVYILKKNRQVSGQKSYSALTKFTSWLDASKLGKKSQNINVSVSTDV